MAAVVGFADVRSVACAGVEGDELDAAVRPDRRDGFVRRAIAS
jgi:hypothetical protein